MAGPLDIQRFPTGLLDLLGLKATGQTPSILASQVQATLADCVDYYLLNRRVQLSGATPIGLIANSNQPVNGLLVPATELWFVYNVSVRLTLPTGAGITARFWGTVTDQASPTLPLCLTETANIAAIDQQQVCRVFERPHLFGPGTQFGVSSGAIVGAPGAATMNLSVARLTL